MKNMNIQFKKLAKNTVIVLSIATFLVAMIPAYALAIQNESAPRTVWENPYTLTTYHANNQINSIFYTFPKVIWDGSKYVDYIYNSSDMSGGIGSVFIKVFPDHTAFYDPYQTEERIESESWTVEYRNTSSSAWVTDNTVGVSVYSLTNTSGIYFIRTVTLGSGASLKESYWLRIGSKLKISVVLHAVKSAEYKLVWLLDHVLGTKACWLNTYENVTSQVVDDKSCSQIQFASENESKCLVDWSDACFLNKTSGKWESCFQELRFERGNCIDRHQARVTFANISLKNEESLILDPTIQTFNSDESLDGYIFKDGTSYPPNDETDIVKNSTSLTVGQAFLSIYYWIYRSYLSFDTSLVPALAYNISATLKLRTKWIDPDTNYTMQVWGGNQVVYSDNVTILDGIQPIYNKSLTTNSWGAGRVKIAEWDTANYANFTYINLTIPANQISKCNNTEFELNCSRDGISPPQPGHSEWLAFYSGDSDNPPKLEVSYSLDKVTLDSSSPVTWFYRNVSASKAIVAIFGGIPSDTSILVRSIDSGEKELGKVLLLDALLGNSFSVFTPSNSSGYTDLIYYQNDSKWIYDMTMYLMYNQSYAQVYIFGFSGGGVVTGNEIQKDYATRFSAAAMNCAPVNWSEYDGQIYHTALTASKAKVATSFPENIEDWAYYQMKCYYDNMDPDAEKEWHNWLGGHGAFFAANYTCINHTRAESPGENDSVAVITWFNDEHQPSTPFKPSGTQSGQTDISYSYSSGTFDSDGENMTYQFNWGDGSNSNTTSYPSGQNVSCSHSWNNPGAFNVTVRAKDASNHWSCWSPLLTVTMEEEGGCPYIYTWNGSSYVKDNNILPASEIGNGTDTNDYYKLEQSVVPTSQNQENSTYSLKIREFESEHDYIDQVKLEAVDHAENVNIAVTSEGEIITYQKPISPITCTDNNDTDRLGQISAMDGNVSDPSTYFEGYPGDWLTLNFGNVTASNASLIFRDDWKCQDVCINVQVPDGNGTWQTVEVLHPRSFWSMEAVNMSEYIPSNGNFTIRLYWTAPHRLDYVGLDTSTQVSVTVTSATPTSATHSVLGNVTQNLLYDDENMVELVNGQEVTMDFILPNNAANTVRDFVFFTNGYYYTITY